MSENQRPDLRDCPFCGTKGSDDGKILVTADADLFDGFHYSFSIRCMGCGISLHDEYLSEVVRLWNGKLPTEEEGE
jgi:hypothetical protein